jgi:UDP-N-acetylglucosamine 1-carboxyvinyltransferase
VLAGVGRGWDTETMDRFVVRSGAELDGSVDVQGAKNSALKLMAASLLAEGEYTLRNVPRIADVDIMADLLRSMGLAVRWTGDGALLITRPAAEACVPEAPYELVERMRASILVLGPLLGRFGRARVALPGGDDFGTRPIDFHLAGLAQMGAEFEFAHGVIEARAETLLGTRVVLEFPSVGATENILLGAVLAKGTSVIENAAREPEITDLAAFLNRMGAIVEGAGSSTITVEGVDELNAVEHTVIPDRIEAATFLAAVGLAGGEITINGARAEHMDMLVHKLGEMGLRISATSDGLWACRTKPLRAVDVSTLPYPGVATDYKPLLVALLSVADGVGIVTENIYGANRYTYIAELQRMGADISVADHHAVVRGVGRLSGAPVKAHDVRAGAALVVAGLAADGDTVVSDAHHIDRGYEDLAAKLRALGADVTRG